MDCSPEYMEDCQSKESTDSTSSIICHSFQQGGVFDPPKINRQCEQVLSDEKITEGKEATIENVSSQKSVVFKADAIKGRLFQGHPAAKEQLVQHKKMLAAKQRWERCHRRQDEQESQFIEKQGNLQLSKADMIKRTKESKDKCAKIVKEIVDFQFDIDEEGKAMNSKTNAVETLQLKLQEHKARIINSMQTIRDTVEVYTVQLIGEQFQLENQLRQRWRLFGKSKLRQELYDIEKLREKVETVANKLKIEIDYLEAAGKFKLSPK